MIELLHAYSRSNRGDGWLVELSLGILREATGREVELIRATDPQSFSGLPTRFVRPGGGKGRLMLRTLAGGLPGLAGQRALPKEVRPDDYAVGVGGGYLRASSSLQSQATFLAVHQSQLDLAVRHARSVYLPQSIGPFPPRLADRVRMSLQRLNRVYVRDDTSAALLDGMPNVRRCPDLAVLEIGRGSPTRLEGERVALILRDVGDDKANELQAAIHRQLTGATLVLQADAGRNNSDSRFYTSILDTSTWDTPDSLYAEGNPREVGLVVSTRLHGALEAISRGLRAIHLSYERKGLGAFTDLGLADYCFDVRSARPSDVLDAASSLLKDGADYDRALAAELPRIAASRQTLVDDLRGILR